MARGRVPAGREAVPPAAAQGGGLARIGGAGGELVAASVAA
jgi:hypothetical protein